MLSVSAYINTFNIQQLRKIELCFEIGWIKTSKILQFGLYIR